MLRSTIQYKCQNYFLKYQAQYNKIFNKHVNLIQQS